MSRNYLIKITEQIIKEYEMLNINNFFIALFEASLNKGILILAIKNIVGLFIIFAGNAGMKIKVLIYTLK